MKSAEGGAMSRRRSGDWPAGAIPPACASATSALASTQAAAAAASTMRGQLTATLPSGLRRRRSTPGRQVASCRDSSDHDRTSRGPACAEWHRCVPQPRSLIAVVAKRSTSRAPRATVTATSSRTSWPFRAEIVHRCGDARAGLVVTGCSPAAEAAGRIGHAVTQFRGRAGREPQREAGADDRAGQQRKGDLVAPIRARCMHVSHVRVPPEVLQGYEDRLRGPA